MRWAAVALLLTAFGCVATTSVTRTGTGLFAPKDNPGEEENAPRGLSLSIGMIAADGTVTLDLRNYSSESFTFAGTPDQPQLVIEVESGNTHSRHTVSPLVKQMYELPAGERIQLKAKIGGLSGRLRIGIRSREFGYVVWSEGITR